MNMKELKRILLAVCPTGEVEWDEQNQIIFYTGLTDDEAGNLQAAAPELLAGLKAAVESLVEVAQYEEAAQDMVATGWFDQAVKAIAKAEGRSE